MAELTDPVAQTEVHDELDSKVQSRLSSETQSVGETKEGGEDQPLESHEVIELQTFSERKAWIEEKIKFLESLPPINVFTGLEQLRASAEEVPGLPTREELQVMVSEHDAIEKETEIFDTGELKKLRQLTKAATQRNLSPADTDLIELTLTTIYELDKLLHLLRDRSDNLDLMNIRLTWEENRQAGWRERRQIVEDLRTFAVNRARWNPSIYDVNSTNDESSDNPPRRGSVASLASTGSSDNIVNSPAFSRSARFKLAEILSRDAAQFTGRVTSLKHGTVTAAGKALDKMIDHSRKPVPDELLDEQDRLEERCMTELDNIGKFTLSLVMQWRKADEIYVETMKDQISAANLLEEIETAQMYHPTARQSTSFISRIDTILKRLAVRGNPASPVNLFPRPEHSLFPDQREANDALIQKLSNDISATNRLARRVDIAAKEYRSRYDAVKRVETLIHSASELAVTLNAVIKKFYEGVPGDDGDGAPPDLTSNCALESTSHSVFLALLPSLLEETNSAVENAEKLLLSASSILLGLDVAGIDRPFKENATASIRELSSIRDEAARLRDSTVQQVTKLRESRKIASNIDTKFGLLKTARLEIARGMELHRWHQETSDGSAPLTPESPLAELHTPSPPSLAVEEQLAKVSSSLQEDIGEPLDNLSLTLEPELQFILKQRFSNLQTAVDASYQMLRLLASIKEQTSSMLTVRDSFDRLSMQIEDAKIRCSSLIDVLESCSDDAAKHTSKFTTDDLESIRKEVTSFVDGLPSQVPFIARHSRLSKRASLMSPISPVLNDPNGLVDIWSEIPFDLASVDAVVRADSNAFAIRINGHFESLLQMKTHLDLAMLGKQLDDALSTTLYDINALTQQLFNQKDFFAKVIRHSPETIGHLRAMLDDLSLSRTRRNGIARSLSPIRELLRRMEEISRPLSPSVRGSLYESRVNATDDAELRLSTWDDQVEALKHDVCLAIDDEKRYQEELRVADERRRKEEEEHRAAEEAERLRCEQERLKEAERKRREQVLIEEARRDHERQRLAVEKERFEKEAAEAELRRREEEERQAVVARLKSEQERVVKEEAQKTLREQEKQEMMEKLRLAEERLEDERRMHAENERISKELAEKQQMEMEKLAQRQAEMEKAETERLALEEQKRAKQKEVERLEREENQRLALEANKKREREEVEKVQDEKKRSASEARKKRETEEKVRLEKEEKKRSALEERKTREREEREKLALEARRKREKEELERLEKEDKRKFEQAEKQKKLREARLPKKQEDIDVFVVQRSPSTSQVQLPWNILRLQSQIIQLRKQLRAIGIKEAIRPIKSSADLPTERQLETMANDFANIYDSTQELPANVDDVDTDRELQSFRIEVEEVLGMLEGVQRLVHMQEAVKVCDGALSDLLEHIDSYPAPPLGTLSSSHKTQPGAPPEEQLSSRLAFTKRTVDDVTLKLKGIASDARATSEHDRIQQAWSELNEMAIDRIVGKKSRSPSVVSGHSSGHNSTASTQQPVLTHARNRKTGSYSNLSVSSVTLPHRPKMLVPPPQNTARRAVSGLRDTPSRSASRLSSTTTNRSVSGPLRNLMHESTFASRQRTTSLSNSTSTPLRPPALAPAIQLMSDSEKMRAASPTMFDYPRSQSRSFSRMARTPSRSSINSSTWARAPRNSLSSIIQRNITPQKKAAQPPPEKYIADPKSKLDIAVGDVVNKLPVGINVEGITESWRDQSGKYWIGNEDPKLCFCRILRSQTVMVRVGGGWAELSKFIKNHFADSFRILPESPPKAGAHEAKWISSATLLEGQEEGTPPRTPEPTFPFVPSFSLLTPSGQSSRSLKSSPSTKGSPLTPLQFIRRADADLSIFRPVTPSKSPHRSRMPSNPNTPVWRP